MSDQFLRTTAAARRANCSAETIRVAARKGRLLPAVVTEDGLRLYSTQEIDRFMREREKARRAKTAAAKD